MAEHGRWILVDFSHAVTQSLFEVSCGSWTEVVVRLRHFQNVISHLNGRIPVKPAPCFLLHLFYVLICQCIDRVASRTWISALSLGLLLTIVKTHDGQLYVYGPLLDVALGPQLLITGVDTAAARSDRPCNTHLIFPLFLVYQWSGPSFFFSPKMRILRFVDDWLCSQGYGIPLFFFFLNWLGLEVAEKLASLRSTEEHASRARAWQELRQFYVRYLLCNLLSAL